MKKRMDPFEQKLFQIADQEKMILPDTLYEKTEHTFNHLSKHSFAFRMNWKRALILAAALTALCSATVMAAVSAVQQRMEAMNEQEIEDYFVQIYASRLGADHYSRPLTDREQTRMEELRQSYEQSALFPEKALTMISSAEAYNGKGIAFSGDSSTFFLPEQDMSDEELLQIIDFRHRRDYSLQTMKEKTAADEAAFPEDAIRQEAASAGSDSAARETVIPYTGDLEIQKIAAGQQDLFLMGKNAVHRMAAGSGDSELFFDDFDTDTFVSALYEDQKGTVYLALNEQTEDTGGMTIAGRPYRPSLWILNADGAVTEKTDLSSLPLDGNDQVSVVRSMVVDEHGYIYVRAAGVNNALLIVLDSQGNYVKSITSDAYTSHDMGGLCIGRDGRIYTQIQAGSQMGIATIDLQKGALDEVFPNIVPEGTVMLDVIAPGADSDLIFWGYDGIFTYHPGDTEADCVLPAYEAPFAWENAPRCALSDGRLVFADCTEYRTEGEDVFRIPEHVCFYYLSGTR